MPSKKFGHNYLLLENFMQKIESDERPAFAVVGMLMMLRSVAKSSTVNLPDKWQDWVRAFGDQFCISGLLIALAYDTVLDGDTYFCSSLRVLQEASPNRLRVIALKLAQKPQFRADIEAIVVAIDCFLKDNEPLLAEINRVIEEVETASPEPS